MKKHSATLVKIFGVQVAQGLPRLKVIYFISHRLSLKTETEYTIGYLNVGNIIYYTWEQCSHPLSQFQETDFKKG